MPPPASPGPTSGVSGGAGDPRVPRVVDVDAVESNLFRLLGCGATSPTFALAVLTPPYWWLYD